MSRTESDVLNTSLLLWLILPWNLVIGAGAATDSHHGACAYSFQVWTPNQDVLQRLQSLEARGDNLTSHLNYRLMGMKAQMMSAMLMAQNLTHKLEKDLLEQKLQHVQQTIHMKDLRLDLVDVKGESRKIWDFIDQLQDGDVAQALVNVQGNRRRQQEASQSERHLTSNLVIELAGQEEVLVQLRSSVGDLKAEWMLIKREVHEVKADSIQLKFGQKDLKADTMELKSQLDAIATTSTRMRSDLENLSVVHTKLKQSLSAFKGSHSGGQQNQGMVVGDIDWDSERSTTSPAVTQLGDRLADLSLKTGHLEFEVRRVLEENIDMRREINHLASINNITSDDLSRLVDHEENDRDSELPRDCHELYQAGRRVSGVYQARPIGMPQLDNVYCEFINNTGWTLLQRRVDGSISFTRRWVEFKYGFGSLYGEFWAGNELIHKLTHQKSYKLRVDMWDFEGHRGWAEYDEFVVDGEERKYKLRIRGYHGDTGDSFSSHDGDAFSTDDSDNDLDRAHCAQTRSSGWWYNSCYTAHLNGVYRPAWYPKGANGYADGIVWFTWKNSELYSLKQVEMKIRPYYL